MLASIISKTSAPIPQHRGRLWTPPWSEVPLLATTAQGQFDLLDPTQVETLRSLMEAAQRVVVWEVPYLFSNWSVRWHSVVSTERVLCLGVEGVQETLIGAGQRYGLGPQSWSWSPDAPPWHQGASYSTRQLAAQGLAEFQALCEVAQAQEQAIKQRDSQEFTRMVDEIVGPLEALHKRMTTRGVCIDPVKRRRLLDEAPVLLRGLKDRCAAIGISDPSDDMQVSAWAKRNGHEVSRSKTTWDDDLLKDLERVAPGSGIEAVRRFRRLKSITSGWIRGDLDGPDGRVHPIHIAFGQPTGRTQTLYPTVTGLPKELRPLVVAEEGYGLFEVDYEAAEIGVAGGLFRDERVREVYAAGPAVAGIAQRLFPSRLANVPLQEIKDQYRDDYNTAKVATYGSLYGMKATTLGRTIGRDAAAAHQILGALATDVWPEVEQGLMKSVRRAARERRVEITPGLFRAMPMIPADEAYRYVTIPRNTPIQGMCASVFRRACLAVDAALRPYQGYIVLPMHDSLICAAPMAARQEASIAVKEAMEAASEEEMGGFLRLRACIAMGQSGAWCKAGKEDSVKRLLQDPMYRI